mmetsp:Transcript_20060/g.28827  ORF Transcript_20060/g.28827 Transcript_20060/m.28827 type:complete len:99 (-) Transcript_20060:2-298(-)
MLEELKGVHSVVGWGIELLTVRNLTKMPADWDKEEKMSLVQPEVIGSIRKAFALVLRKYRMDYVVYVLTGSLKYHAHSIKLCKDTSNSTLINNILSYS